MEPRKENILIEILQKHVPCSKEKAREALYRHQYDLVSAIQDMKEQMNKDKTYIEEYLYVKGKDLYQTIKELLKQSNLIHLTILKDNKTLLSIPVTITLILFYLYPLLSTLTTVYFIKNEFTIRILRTSH